MDGFTQDAQGGQDENHAQDDTGSVDGREVEEEEEEKYIFIV